MTRRMMTTCSAAALAALALGGCMDQNSTRSDERVHRLDDGDGDGLMEEEGGGVILPDPGDCPVMTYTEIHTVTVDESGMVISETWEVCTQCFEEDGVTPIGEELCYEEPPYPIDVVCEEYDSGDPTLSCYRCYDADGTIVTDECWPLPVECTTDADCPDGQICYLYDGGGMDPGRGGEPSGGMEDGFSPVPGEAGGYCGFPDPCVPVDSLPEDPTGESCWTCTDPATGEDWGSWCDVHRCADDGSCVNPWEICDPAGSGYCVYDDPCDPVPSLPSDPTGSDCYQCIDPATGEDWGGWCNVHTCTTDEECAARGEVCNEDTGLCEWVDPCVPVDSLPSDPTGSDCYQCTDPVTGDDWGGWCNVHTCATDADCLDSGFGNVCIDGTCACAPDLPPMM